jgi:hypothetical protein
MVSVVKFTGVTAVAMEQEKLRRTDFQPQESFRSIPGTFNKNDFSEREQIVGT